MLTGVEHLTSGSLFFWVHSTIAVKIERLEIDAALTERLVTGVRQRWVDDQLREI